MAQFGLMHDLATGILCQGSNSLVPNLHIRYNVTYSTYLLIFTDKSGRKCVQNTVSKCVCCGSVTRCLHNTCSQSMHSHLNRAM
jgi:hypothetical protein